MGKEQPKFKLDEERIRIDRENGKLGRRILFSVITIALCYLLSRVRYLGSFEEKGPVTSVRIPENDDDFDWYKVYPSEKLHWVDCYKKFHCARLQVPIDYAKPHEEKAAVALIRYPSRYSVEDPRWKGPILYNPGGPGGSGVQTILESGSHFAEVIGDEYDHVGFDPRGISKTTPSFNLFPSRIERMIWDSRVKLPLNTSDDIGFSTAVSNSELIGDIAEEKTSVGKYMSTAIVARDMMSILKAYGREKIMYWGFSYGTVVGITFASMFPNNIERLVVDGVVDTYDYYTGLWSNNLLDMETVYDNILSACAAFPRCAFYSSNATSTSASVSLRQRLARIFESLNERPVKVLIHNQDSDADGINYGLVDREFARLALFKVLYHPRRNFLELSHALKALEEGNGRPLWEFEQRKDSLARCQCSTGSPNGFPPMNDFIVPETAPAVACSDGNPAASNVESLKRFYKELLGESGFGEFWGTRMACHGWKTRPVERYTGPFGGKTTHPIMLIGNTADPVTPLAYAKKMSTKFEGAVYLTQNSTGHTSTSAPSLCTSNYIRQYFRNGILPPKGTVCQTDTPMFGNETAFEDHLMGLVNEEEKKLAMAGKKLSESMRVPYFGL